MLRCQSLLENIRRWISIRQWGVLFWAGLLAGILFLGPVSGAIAARKQSYSPDQLEQIQQYLPQLQELRDRLTDLEPLIQNRDWNEVKSFIHGPMGDLRRRVNYLGLKLDRRDRRTLIAQGRDLFQHLNDIDRAAEQNNLRSAANNYQEALKDFDRLLELTPKG